MGSIAAIVTMGFGTFGSVNLLTTMGYGSSDGVTGPYCFHSTFINTAGPRETVMTVGGPVATMAKTAGPQVTVGGCRCG